MNKNPTAPALSVPAGTPPRPHLIWLDCVRWLAMFLVVMCHACDPFNCSKDALGDPELIRWGAFWGSFLRPCVPLFVMITGALLLPVRETSLSAFYKKRIPRVLIPFLIWSTLYTLFPWFSGLITSSEEAARELTTTFFPYSSFMNDGAGPTSAFADAAKNVAAIPLTFNSFSVHMWYVYMLIGLYLYLPVFSAWVEKISLKTKCAFLGIWGVTLVLPYAQTFLAPQLPLGGDYLFGACSWNAFGTFYAFAGFNGYLLLGNVIAQTARERGVGKTLAVAIPLFAVGTLLTYIGFFFVRSAGALDNPELFAALKNLGGLSGKIAECAGTLAPAAATRFQAEPMIELFWTYCSLNVVMTSAALFLVCSKISLKEGRFSRFLGTMAKIGFGVYLVHYFFVGPSYVLAVKLGVPLVWQIPCSALFAFAGTYLLLRLLYAVVPRPKIFFG